MTSSTQLNRIIIIAFMILVGYSLAYGFRTGSLIGISLSITSLCAGIYFLYLLAKMKREMQGESEE